MKKNRTHTSFLFHFPVAKALKKSIFEKTFLRKHFFGGSGGVRTKGVEQMGQFP